VENVQGADQANDKNNGNQKRILDVSMMTPGKAWEVDMLVRYVLGHRDEFYLFMPDINIDSMF
jgi:hypothetical protein